MSSGSVRRRGEANIIRTNTVVLPYTDAGVGGAEIDTDSFWHGGLCAWVDVGFEFGEKGTARVRWRGLSVLGDRGEILVGLYIKASMAGMLECRRTHWNLLNVSASNGQRPAYSIQHIAYRQELAGIYSTGSSTHFP